MRNLYLASAIFFPLLCFGFLFVYEPASKPIPIHVYEPKPEPPFVLPDTHQQREIQVGNRSRIYWLYRPEVVKSNALVVVLHGGGPGWREVLDYGWSELAESQGFTVVYPIGEDGRWVYNTHFTYSNLPDTDIGKDFDMLNLLIDEMVEELEINPRRVYFTGFSMGGMMSHEFAAHYPERVAAIGPVAGTATVGEVKPELRTSPTEPVPAVILHGKEDREIPFAEAKPSAEMWAGINECEPPVVEEFPEGRAYRLRKYEEGARDTAVWFYSLPDVAHRWPKRLGNESSVEVMWSFFKQFRNPLNSHETRRRTLRGFAGIAVK